MQPNAAGPMRLPSHLVDQLPLTLELIKLGAQAMSKGSREGRTGQDGDRSQQAKRTGKD